MENLVVSNILYRKTRTLATIAGVALGVVLVVLTVGIVHGFLEEQGRRNSAITAEIMFGPPGSTFGLSISPMLSLDVKYVDELRKIEGVQDAVPIGQLLRGRMIDGIDYEQFKKVSAARVIETDREPFTFSGDEAIIDRVQQRQRNWKVGEEIEMLNRKFRIVGVYEPESLARVKIPLATLQEYENRKNVCTMILVKVADPSKQTEVAARIKQTFPDYGVMLTRDLPILISQGTPALNTFLDVVVLLAIIVSSLVILLTMYTTVTERTRQIGVLKSLGASKFWIAGEIEKEALLISSLGVVAGFALSVIGKFIITRLTTMSVTLEPMWLLYALALGMLAGVLGALYPALRAANQDPVEALAYE
ncbi:MAG TPA: ABC transporter permease [Blastocatellia bacterium]|nr:ABC transporter permease [Blastocatellia bacterium]